MKEKYMEQVKRCLVISRKQKAEIICDLQEIFSSALEHGETERQVIERLGSPADFADNIHEQLNINRAERHNRKYRIVAAVIMVFVIFVICLFVKLSGIPDGAIGQADGMTNVRLNGAAVEPYLLFAGSGAIALIAAITWMARYFKNNKEITT